MSASIEDYLEDLYPIKILEKRKVRDNIFITAKSPGTSDTSFLFKPSELSAERLLFLHTALLHLAGNGFTATDICLETKEGLPFAATEDTVYTLTPLYTEGGYSFDNKAELGTAARLLARMHLAGSGFTEEKARRDLTAYALPYTVKCCLGDTPATFARRLAELKRFRRVASKGGGIFDYTYLTVADYYCDLGDMLLKELSDSPYEKLVEEGRMSGCFCHRDFTGHNTAKHPPEGVICNFENASIELPIYDVANLLRRRLRKCGWQKEDAEYILQNYDTVRPLSREEMAVLKILLQFPQKLWRVVNKYYNSKRGRHEKSSLSKLQEIINEKEPMNRFVKAFWS